MPKKRVHEIAKETGLTTKEVLEKFAELDCGVKNNPSAAVGEEQEAMLLKSLNKATKRRQDEPKKAEEAFEAKSTKEANSIEETPTIEKAVDGQKTDERPASEKEVASVTVARRRPQRKAYVDGKLYEAEVKSVKPDVKIKKDEIAQPKITEKADDLATHKIDEPINQVVQKTIDQNVPPRTASGERPVYQPKPWQDGRPPKPDKPPYQKQDNKFSNQPRQEQGERPPYQPRQGQGERPPYQPRQGQGDRRPPYQPRQGQGDRPPYQPRQGQGERPPYQPRQGQGERPPYQPRQGQGDRPPYQPRQGQGDRPPYQPRQGQGDRPPYQPRQGQDGGRQFQPRQDSGGFNQRQSGGFGGGRPSGGFSNNSGFSSGGRSGSTKQTEKKPDKNERLKKIQDSRRVKNQERDMDDMEKNFRRNSATAKKVIIESKEPKLIQIPSALTLKELAAAMNKAGAEVVKLMMKKGKMMMINDTVDFETASEIALEFNILTEEKLEVDILVETFGEEEEDASVKQPRPPVVVVMGHVDHGKTSLLDAIRNANIVSGEAGGITQHIGAYTVSINDKPITFLDTPGHEAFTAMRMRGAKATDIAILVVAANDGVMPQTIEAISHAKAAGVEIIVAINKIDLPGANPDKVKQELSEQGLVIEEWGGDTICVQVSAKARINLDGLLEMVTLVAEMKDYKANPNKRARGTVIEAYLDKGRGPVATVLVQDGTLEVGNSVVAGVAYGKIRAMTDDKGNKLKKAGPSVPVEILGLSEPPTAGDLFHVAINDKQARHVAQNIFAKGRVELIKETPQKVTLDDLYSQIKEGNIKELNVIVKADAFGSVEAIKGGLDKLTTDEVRVRVILGGVGAVTESDVSLAAASGAIIIGFNVRPEVMAKSLADEQGVDIRLYRVIYEAFDDVEKAMKGLLDPIYKEKVMGHAQIRQTFKASSVGTIAGCYITDGKFMRSYKVRILRDNIVVYDGGLEALRRFKDDVREVATGYECGMLFSRFNDIKENDVVEAYVMEEIER